MRCINKPTAHFYKRNGHEVQFKTQPENISSLQSMKSYYDKNNVTEPSCWKWFLKQGGIPDNTFTTGQDIKNKSLHLVMDARNKKTTALKIIALF